MTQKNTKVIVIPVEVDNMILKLGLMRDSYADVIKKLIIYYNNRGKTSVNLKRNEEKFLGARFIYKTVNGERVIAGWETVKLDKDTGKRYKIVDRKRIEMDVM